MTGANHINDVVQKVLDAMPEGLKNAPDDIRQNLRDAVSATFNKLDLVTREEFDVQKKVLLRTREKLEILEKQLEALEKQP